jgi:hypothetical protein
MYVTIKSKYAWNSFRKVFFPIQTTGSKDLPATQYLFRLFKELFTGAKWELAYKSRSNRVSLYGEGAARSVEKPHGSICKAAASLPIKNLLISYVVAELRSYVAAQSASRVSTPPTCHRSVMCP